MTENRYRPSSPPGRRYGDPRASTGTVFSSSFDPRYPSQPRYAIDPSPGARHGSVYATQAGSRKTILDETHPGGGSIVRTEYPVRPRNNSTIGAESRRPISTYVTRPASPPRVRPAIIAAASRDDPRSPVLAAREDRYLMPAATHDRHHHRHSSASRADQDRLDAGRAGRQSEYHRRGGYNAHPSSLAPSQDEGYSYTTPKEQFLQESSRVVPQRRESYSRRERPISTIGLPEYRQSVRREPGPPPSSSRALERVDRVDSARNSNPRIADTVDRGAEPPHRRSSVRAPVVHHYRDDGYTSAREERKPRPPPKSEYDRFDDDRLATHKYRDERERNAPREAPRDLDRRERERDRDREREKERERDRDRDRERDRDRTRELEKPPRPVDDRRPPRSRETSPDHSGLRKGLSTAAAVAAGATLAGVAAKKSRSPNDDSDSEDKDRKHRRRRHHHAGDEPSPDQLAGRVERDLKLSNGADRVPHERRRDDPRAEDAIDEGGDRHERRRHRRHKHRDRPDRGDESDTEGSDPRDGRERTYERVRDKENDLREPARQRRDRAPSRDNDRDVPSSLEQRTISPGEEEDGRPRRVQLVEPGEKKEDIKPKGILKPPRAVPFPEDPHPEREGVAPLKDATKDGIPPNARWTKISRALVNPEALEKLHERFEERDDYVIVLRVVSREEIMKLAEKTTEIREARERQWQAELKERQTKGRRDDEGSSDDEQRPRLAIEETHPVQGIQGDPRVYLAQQQQQQQQARHEQYVPIQHPGNAVPQMAAPPPPPQGLPVPDIRVDPIPGSYSTNV